MVDERLSPGHDVALGRWKAKDGAVGTTRYQRRQRSPENDAHYVQKHHLFDGHAMTWISSAELP
jgi:hypothetical protein